MRRQLELENKPVELVEEEDDGQALAEGVASSKASELAESLWAYLEFFGDPQTQPIFLGTDNKANMHIANDRASTARLRHALRRYLTLQERVRDGIVSVGHVKDAANPSDFLTKLVPAKKLNESVEYATNYRNVVGGARA